jgi:hypothetical protein
VRGKAWSWMSYQGWNNLWPSHLLDLKFAWIWCSLDCSWPKMNIVPWWLASSTLIILTSENFQFSKNIFYSMNKMFWKKIKNLLKYSEIFYFSKWNLHNKIIIQHWNVELTMVLGYQPSQHAMDVPFYKDCFVSLTSQLWCEVTWWAILMLHVVCVTMA